MKKRPNIIVILTDDQGIWTLGCYGNIELPTPNLDRLAAAGMRFDNFFCVSPVCSPARASLLTGAIPSTHGVHDWIRGGNSRENPIEYLAGRKGYTDFLAENDYICGLSGKWHLGASAMPQKSFSHWYAHEGGVSSYYNAPMYRNDKPEIANGYLTDLITDDALEFIKINKDGDSPFYLSLHYTAPHSPWIDNHPREVVEIFDDCPFVSCPQEPEHPWASHLTKQCLGNREQLKGYFAAVNAMDTNVGRILDYLETAGIREETLIFFTSDNGFSCGHHGFWGKGNGTFPLNMYENSVKVPMIISHPGIIPEGASCDALLSHYDFMPTLLDYLKISNPKQKILPGKSFLPLLRNGNSNDIQHENIVVFDEYGPVRMIRTKEWKYIHRYPYGPNELYNLRDDPDERENLIKDKGKGKIIRDLNGMLQEWFCTYADQKVDGCREAVTGRGQLTMAGINSKGYKTYEDLDVF